MCTGMEIAALVGAGASAVGAISAASNKPDIQAPKPPPQASKAPDVGTLRRQNQAGAMAGVPSTLLTGSGGVDPGTLTIGRNTLLGS